MNRDKDTLRRIARERRASAHGYVDPAPALERLKGLLSGTDGPVSFYWPIRTEIDPRPVMLALQASRTVCLPVTHGRDAALTFRRWHEGMDMEKDGFGVSIPALDEPVTPRVLVVPMLAFDSRCHRLGYGAGHYDRTLAALRLHARVVAIGLAYAAQHSDADLPVEATDQPLDAIVTEFGIVRPENGSSLAWQADDV